MKLFENTLSEESDFKPRGELVKEIGKLRSENKLLRDDINQKKIVLEKYETELKRYRSQAFVENKFEGVRKYNRELIAVLKQGIVLDSYKLLEELGIDPNDSQLVKAISQQLEELEGIWPGYLDQTWLEVGGMTESQDKMASSSLASLDLPAELIRRYKEDCEIRGMSPESQRRYISSLKIYNQIPAKSQPRSAKCRS